MGDFGISKALQQDPSSGHTHATKQPLAAIPETIIVDDESIAVESERATCTAFFVVLYVHRLLLQKLRV